MLIYINSRFLTQPVTGVQRYAIELSLKLKKIDPSIEFVCPKNVVQHDIFERLNAKVIGNRTGHLWEQIDLPKYLKKEDLLINLCNTAPIIHRKKIVTVHDLAFLQKWHSLPFRIYYNFLIPKILKSSLEIITVSNTIKKEINNKYQIDLNKIHVIYNAVSCSYQNYPIVSVNEKYILFVGSMDPRKNLLSIILAFDMINDTDVKLKIVGGQSKVFKKLNLKYNPAKVEFLGRISDNVMPQLYSNAIAFIFPSLYEGFGMPPLEAISFGCPVIGSDIEVLHEIYGNAMMYFNPTNIQSIIETINEICTNSESRINLVLEGQKILSKYSFEISANQLYHLIKSVKNTNNDYQK
jgi:glycosyltransferase involved in cell wall biosynthesis